MSFFFNDTATTEIYTLSLHDALPILYRIQYDTASMQYLAIDGLGPFVTSAVTLLVMFYVTFHIDAQRSEEHTSELQSQSNLVCRLLLEKKKRHESYTSRTSTRTPHAL